MSESTFVESLETLGKAVRHGSVDRVSSLGICYVIEDGSEQVYSIDFDGDHPPVEAGTNVSFVAREGTHLITAYAKRPPTLPANGDSTGRDSGDREAAISID